MSVILDLLIFGVLLLFWWCVSSLLIVWKISFGVCLVELQLLCTFYMLFKKISLWYITTLKGLCVAQLLVEDDHYIFERSWVRGYKNNVAKFRALAVCVII